MNKLENEEKEILQSFENDEWQSVENLDGQRLKYMNVAKNTSVKNKRINIRLSEKDLVGLKAKSMEEGLPYQTLVSSIIHKYVSGKIKFEKL